MAISRDQQEDGKRTFSVLLISLPEGQIERILKGPFTDVPSLAFSGDSKWLACSCADKSITIWNMNKAGDKPEKTLTAPALPRSLALSPDGKHLAQSGEWSGILDVATGKEVRKLFVGGGGEKVAYSPDGKTLAFATHHGLRLFDAEGKQRAVAEEKVHYDAVAFSADSKTVLVSEAAVHEGTTPPRGALQRVRQTETDLRPQTARRQAAHRGETS